MLQRLLDDARDDQRLANARAAYDAVRAFDAQPDRTRASIEGTAQTLLRAYRIARVARSARGGEITAEAGNNSFAVNLDITQPDLALGTDILADVLLNATMPANAVAREKEIQLAKIKDEDEKPNWPAGLESKV